MTDDRGLYDKYEVYEDGEEITEEVFVLRPTTDVAARAALWAYANATDDDELAADIREWVGGIAANGGDETDA